MLQFLGNKISIARNQNVYGRWLKDKWLDVNKPWSIKHRLEFQSDFNFIYFPMLSVLFSFAFNHEWILIMLSQSDMTCNCPRNKTCRSKGISI